MARGLRIEYPNALYHVMSRGNEQQAIFHDDEDYLKRMRLLERAVHRDGWIVHAFVLMTNHDHLLIETPRGNFSRGVHGLNSCYARYFNRRHGRSGHLFQGRPQAHPIDGESYFAMASRYIHLNPWKAGMVSDPSEYPWSSYPGYLDRKLAPSFVTVSDVLGGFGRQDDHARREYRSFVDAGMREDIEAPWAGAGRDGIVGSEEFEQRIRSVLDHLPGDVELPRLRACQYRPPLEEVVSLVVSTFGRQPWVEGSRCDDPSRCIAAWLAREAFGYSAVAIANALGYRNPSGVSAAVRRARRLPPAIRMRVASLRETMLERRSR